MPLPVAVAEQEPAPLSCWQLLHVLMSPTSWHQPASATPTPAVDRHQHRLLRLHKLLMNLQLAETPQPPPTQ